MATFVPRLLHFYAPAWLLEAAESANPTLGLGVSYLFARWETEAQKRQVA